MQAMAGMLAYVKSAEGAFLRLPDQWTYRRDEATEFDTTREAIEAAKKCENREGLVVIVRFSDTGQEIWVPVAV